MSAAAATARGPALLPSRLPVGVDVPPRCEQELTGRVEASTETRPGTQGFGPGQPRTVEQPVVVAAASLPREDGPLDGVGVAQIRGFRPQPLRQFVPLVQQTLQRHLDDDLAVAFALDQQPPTDEGVQQRVAVARAGRPSARCAASVGRCPSSRSPATE